MCKFGDHAPGMYLAILPYTNRASADHRAAVAIGETSDANTSVGVNILFFAGKLGI